MRSTDSEHAAPTAPSVFVIQLEGEFDFAERERLTDAFSIASETPVVVVNLKRTTYMDSSILQCLAALHVATERRGARLTVTGVHGSVRHLLQITGLHGLFDVRNEFSEVAGSNGQMRRLTIEARLPRGESNGLPSRDVATD